jgi:hypothetical protein
MENGQKVANAETEELVRLATTYGADVLVAIMGKKSENNLQNA